MHEDFNNLNLPYEPFLKKEAYDIWRAKTTKKMFFPKMILPFTASDIEYIILKDEKEVSTTIKQIEKYTKLFTNKDEFRTLLSKIYPANKIIDDI